MKIKYLPRIQDTISKFFFITSAGIILSALCVGLFFNKVDEREKQKNNIQRIHSVLSHLIVPSMIISDTSEVRRLLYMASEKDEKFIVMDSDGSLIVPDYSESQFIELVSGIKNMAFCKTEKIVYKDINGKKYLINCSILQESGVESENKKLGFLVSFTNYELFTLSSVIVYLIGVLFILLFLLTIIFRKILYRNLLLPLLTLKDSIMRSSVNAMSENPSIDTIKNAPREIIEIKDVFGKLLQNLHDEYTKRLDAEKMKALIDLVAGVAHDIRSPLTALDVIIKDIKNIPEDQRIVIRNSATRINDIANNLLTQYKQNKNVSTVSSQSYDREILISDLLLSLISEKRAQYRGYAIQLIQDIEDDAYGKFIKVYPSAFNRVISNLIDNAIEANSSEISIRLKRLIAENSLLVEIADNGCGIPQDILNKIIEGEGYTNKSKGHGLGLQYVVNTITNEWTGNFNISSVLHNGTIIKITLPQVSSPTWFLPNLNLDPKKLIVIVDDDESIHQVWKKRLYEVSQNLTLIHLHTLYDLTIWYNNNSDKSAIFLIDYEFSSSNKNGLSVIDELGIADRSCLVTSRYEDLQIREYSEKIGLKIIPKTYAVYIPIQLNSFARSMVDFVFIDDDISITGAWVLHAMTKGKVVAAYNSIRDFKLDMHKFALETPIYIDSELNDEINGQQFAKELYEKGYNNLFLATGHSFTSFPEMYWINKIVGKKPPF